MKKGQSAVEFVLLISLVFGVFVIFFAVLSNKIVQTSVDKDKELLTDFSTYIENEIKLAASVEDGYIRYLEIPKSVLAQEVNASLQIASPGPAALLVVNYTYILPGFEVVTPLPSTISIGCDLQVGENCISKQKGLVYINKFNNCGGAECLCADKELDICPS